MHRRSLRSMFLPPVVAGALLIAGAPASLAGSICGTVRDAQSLQPVPGAGVFLFDNLDQYTGRYAGTDLAGHYCIDNVPDGIYTLQVRVDNHLAAVVRNVVVDDATGVDIATRTPFYLATPFPNPATGDVVFHFVTPDGIPTAIDVFDVHGRLVMGWEGRGTGGGRDVRWDLRDAGGSPVASGIYLVRLRAEGRVKTHRFVCLR